MHVNWGDFDGVRSAGENTDGSAPRCVGRLRLCLWRLRGFSSSHSCAWFLSSSSLHYGSKPHFARCNGETSDFDATGTHTVRSMPPLRVENRGSKGVERSARLHLGRQVTPAALSLPGCAVLRALVCAGRAHGEGASALRWSRTPSSRSL